MSFNICTITDAELQALAQRALKAGISLDDDENMLIESKKAWIYYQCLLHSDQFFIHLRELYPTSDDSQTELTDALELAEREMKFYSYLVAQPVQKWLSHCIVPMYETAIRAFHNDSSQHDKIRQVMNRLPEYLSDLIQLLTPIVQSIREDNDFDIGLLDQLFDENKLSYEARSLQTNMVTADTHTFNTANDIVDDTLKTKLNTFTFASPLFTHTFQNSLVISSPSGIPIFITVTPKSLLSIKASKAIANMKAISWAPIRSQLFPLFKETPGLWNLTFDLHEDLDNNQDHDDEEDEDDDKHDAQPESDEHESVADDEDDGDEASGNDSQDEKIDIDMPKPLPDNKIDTDTPAGPSQPPPLPDISDLPKEAEDKSDSSEPIGTGRWNRRNRRRRSSSPEAEILQIQTNPDPQGRRRETSPTSDQDDIDEHFLDDLHERAKELIDLHNTDEPLPAQHNHLEKFSVTTNEPVEIHESELHDDDYIIPLNNGMRSLLFLLTFNPITRKPTFNRILSNRRNRFS
jgi:hypothetical protein